MGFFNELKKIFTSPITTSEPTKLPPIVSIYDDVNLCYIEELGDSLDKADVGAKVTLALEPNNEHDKKAVAVLCDGKRIGYLYKGKLKMKFYNGLNRPGVVYVGNIIKRDGTNISMNIEHREDISVYISPKGKSFHMDAFCIKDASGIEEIKLSAALKSGYTPCSKCCK